MGTNPDGPRIELPALYARGADKTILVWRTFTEGSIVAFEHGQLGGKLVVNRARAEPTNIGRANQRNPDQQASFESEAAWVKKTKQGYFESVEQAKIAEVLLPMLAHPITKKAKVKGVRTVTERGITFPCQVQRKLNGLRCLAIVGEDRMVTLKSRQGTVWELLQHIELAVAAIGRPGDIFDGEIYLHGVPLQTINGWIKNGTDQAVVPLRAMLQYNIYDMPRCGTSIGTWEVRRDRLTARFQQLDDMILVAPRVPTLSSLKPVETFTVHSREELDTLAKSFVLAGYEGAIIRQLGHEYAFDRRVEGLLKWKQFTDSEFKVIDVLSRERFDPGTNQSYMILDKCVCQNNTTEATFEVVPLGDMAQKKQWHEQKEQLIGKRLVVRYLERSVDGIPQGNPVGVAFRLDEDLAGLEEDDANPWD